MRQPTREFVYNPEPDFVLEAGTTLIVMGEADGVKKLRTLVARGLTNRPGGLIGLRNIVRFTTLQLRWLREMAESTATSCR